MNITGVQGERANKFNKDKSIFIIRVLMGEEGQVLMPKMLVAKFIPEEIINKIFQLVSKHITFKIDKEEANFLFFNQDLLFSIELTDGRYKISLLNKFKYLAEETQFSADLKEITDMLDVFISKIGESNEV